MISAQKHLEQARITITIEKSLIQAQKMTDSAVTNLDAAMNGLKEKGFNDVDLHGLQNVRRSLAHLAKRIDSEKKLILPETEKS